MKSSIEERLRHTFARLVNKKLSVTQLCERAEISRGSFYLYYKDLDDFLAATEAYIVKKFFLLAGEIFFAEEKELPGLLTSERFAFSKEDKKLLIYFAEGRKYMDFAIFSEEKGMPFFNESCVSHFGEEFYSENKKKIQYLINGITIMLFYGLAQKSDEEMLEEFRKVKKIIVSTLGK